MPPDLQTFPWPAALLMWWLLRRASRSSTLALILLNLPSTILHECGHWVIAFLLGSSPSLPSVFPRKQEGGGWQLGHITARVGTFSALPVGLAPLLILPLWCFLLPKLAPSAQLASFPFVLNAAFPSRADLKTAFSSPLGALFWVAFLSTSSAVLLRLQ